MRRAYQRAKSNTSAGLQTIGVTPMQAAAIMALRNAGTLSQAALGRAIGMERPNVHGLLARLHAMHLIETAPHPTDQRAVQIALSPTGAAHADDIARISAASASETLRPLAPAERELFLDLLARVAAGERHL